MLCAVWPAAAGEPPDLAPPQLTPAQTQAVSRFVDEKLALWIANLGLEDWTVSAQITPRKELKSKTLGGIHWDKDKKTAVIQVMDPADYRLPFDAVLADLEFTIVHELVHLELASLPRSASSRGHEERAVNRLAEALLKLDRR